MHAYLQAIGLSNLTKEQLDMYIDTTIGNPSYQEVTTDSNVGIFTELRLKMCESVYLAVRGTINADDEFEMYYYYPMFIADTESSDADLDIIKESDREGYQCICDEIRLGVNLIFALQNMSDFYDAGGNNKDIDNTGVVKLAGLSTSGMVILPILKLEREYARVEERTRESLIEAAREGDELAMEDLTMDDMDTYAMIGRRIQNEDVLSIVTSTFMPFGIENDKYTVIGDILDVVTLTNEYTMETLYKMVVDANDVQFEVLINSKDLFGEPEIGRRFKGNIWLQGTVDFELG